MTEEKTVPELELLDARKRLDETFKEIERHEAGVRAGRTRADQLIAYIERLHKKYGEHHQQAMSEARLRLAGNKLPVGAGVGT
jgi:hypothetical protein